jgi:hypothetical protein
VHGEEMTEEREVRINVLARQLEVKAEAIVNLLPGLGVMQKKTHSSSIPIEIAEKVRQALSTRKENRLSLRLDPRFRDLADAACERRSITLTDYITGLIALDAAAQRGNKSGLKLRDIPDWVLDDYPVQPVLSKIHEILHELKQNELQKDRDAPIFPEKQERP